MYILEVLEHKQMHHYVAQRYTSWHKIFKRHDFHAFTDWPPTANVILHKIFSGGMKRRACCYMYSVPREETKNHFFQHSVHLFCDGTW